MGYVPGANTPGVTSDPFASAGETLFNLPQDIARTKVILERGGPLPEKYVKPDIRSFGELMLEFARKQPEPLGRIQEELWNAGLYDKKAQWASGLADEESISAYQKALLRAARENKTVSEVIEEAKQAVQASGGLEKLGYQKSGTTGPTQDPLTIRLTHPDDIRATAMQTSAKVLGRGFSAQELDRFVHTYQSMESSAQQAAYSATGSGLPGGPGGTVTAPASVENAATRAAREANPGAAGATDLSNAYDLMLQAMRQLEG